MSFTCIHTHTHTHIYIYIYIKKERKKERKRERERERNQTLSACFYSLGQRVYGVSYPEKKLLKEYKDRIEEAKKRDHRIVGVQQELFFFHELSPGSAFFLPKGAHIHNKLVEFIREEYRKRGYQEVGSGRVCIRTKPEPIN